MERHTENILNRQWSLRGNFNKQTGQVLTAIRMSQPQVDGLQTLYDDIKKTFGKIWPGCRLKVFGSIVTGLALKCSDVDGLLELPVSCNDPKSCVEKCRDLIATDVTPFRDASVTIKKVPTVQFFHAKTGRRCELSFNKPIAVEFNELVRYLLALDARALKLAMLIKYWAKVQHVTGSRRLPSNALVILIIFFLQLKKILPPVAKLQMDPDLTPNIIDGWNTAFTKIAFKSRNNQSVCNLLRQFFECYAQFDFRNLIVCPYLGHPLERGEFMNVDNVPKDFDQYKQNMKAGGCEMIFLNCILCIQDPFEHARNCAGPVRPQVAGEVIQLFQAAAYMCASTLPHTVLNGLLSPWSGEVPPAPPALPQLPPPRRADVTRGGGGARPSRRKPRRARPYPNRKRHSQY